MHHELNLKGLNSESSSLTSLLLIDYIGHVTLTSHVVTTLMFYIFNLIRNNVLLGNRTRGRIGVLTLCSWVPQHYKKKSFVDGNGIVFHAIFILIKLWKRVQVCEESLTSVKQNFLITFKVYAVSCIRTLYSNYWFSVEKYSWSFYIIDTQST